MPTHPLLSMLSSSQWLRHGSICWHACLFSSKLSCPSRPVYYPCPSVMLFVHSFHARLLTVTHLRFEATPIVKISENRERFCRYEHAPVYLSLHLSPSLYVQPPLPSYFAFHSFSLYFHPSMHVIVSGSKSPSPSLYVCLCSNPSVGYLCLSSICICIPLTDRLIGFAFYRSVSKEGKVETLRSLLMLKNT